MKIKLIIVYALLPLLFSCFKKEVKVKPSNIPEKKQQDETTFQQSNEKVNSDLGARSLTPKILKFCNLSSGNEYEAKRTQLETFGDFAKIDLKAKPQRFGDTTIDQYFVGDVARVFIIEFNDTADNMKIEVLCYDESGALKKSQTTIGGVGFNKEKIDSYSTVTYKVEYKLGNPIQSTIVFEASDPEQTLYKNTSPPKPTFKNSEKLM